LAAKQLWKCERFIAGQLHKSAGGLHLVVHAPDPQQGDATVGAAYEQPRLGLKLQPPLGKTPLQNTAVPAEEALAQPEL